MDPYKVSTWGAPVGYGVSDSLHLHISAIGKADTPTGPFCVANELIAGEVGHRVRLPVPPFCVVEDKAGMPFFASLDFNLTGISLPPIFPDEFTANFPAAVGSILVFDAYICNADRHCGNLSADYASSRYNVFDHSHAVLGGAHHCTPGLPRLAQMASSLVIDGAIGGNRHCLLDQLTDDRDMADMLERIETLDDYFLRDVVQSCAEYGLDSATCDGLVNFLMDRRSALRGLIQANKSEFTNVLTWSLL